MQWVNALLHTYSSGWTLTVDADELLVYPNSEHNPLSQLCADLDRLNADGLLCFLIDMYPKSPVSKCVYMRGTPLVETFSYFDGGPYFYIDSLNGPQIYGGARERVFWNSQRYSGPTLSKIPLVRWTPNKRYLISTHTISSIALAYITGCLLHFKFLPDFRARTREYLRAGNNIRGSSAYLRVLANDRDVSLWHSESVKYRGSLQLLEMGLLQDGYDRNKRDNPDGSVTNIFPQRFGLGD